jgi:hypothetical protein
MGDLMQLDLIYHIAALVPVQATSEQIRHSARCNALRPANPPDQQPAKRSPAPYLWAMLIARVLISCWTARSYAKRASRVLN